MRFLAPAALFPFAGMIVAANLDVHTVRIDLVTLEMI